MKETTKIKELLNKVKAVEKGEKLDLSSAEDLSIAVMNLIAIEEHLFFSGERECPFGHFDAHRKCRFLQAAAYIG